MGVDEVREPFFDAVVLFVKLVTEVVLESFDCVIYDKLSAIFGQKLFQLSRKSVTL